MGVIAIDSSRDIKQWIDWHKGIDHDGTGMEGIHTGP